MAKKIKMNKHSGKTFEEVYAAFITAKTAKGVSDVTIRNYHQNLHNISLHLDISTPFDTLTKEMLLLNVIENFKILLQCIFLIECNFFSNALLTKDVTGCSIVLLVLLLHFKFLISFWFYLRRYSRTNTGGAV